MKTTTYTTTATTTATNVYEYVNTLLVAKDNISVFLSDNGLKVVSYKDKNGKPVVNKLGDVVGTVNLFKLSGEMHSAIKGDREYMGAINSVTWHKATEFLAVLNPVVRVEAIDAILADLA